MRPLLMTTLPAAAIWYFAMVKASFGQQCETGSEQCDPIKYPYGINNPLKTA